MIDEGFSVLSESCKGNMVVSNHSQENVYLQNSGSFLPNNDIQAILLLQMVVNHHNCALIQEPNSISRLFKPYLFYYTRNLLAPAYLENQI